MEISLVCQKIKSQVDKSNNILLVCHQQPDADAIGSLVAMGAWLESLGKNCTKFCQDPYPASLDWLASFEPLETDEQKILDQAYDLVILLDSGDLEFAGVDKILPKLKPQPFIINIDHHATNQNFGDINLVDSSFSSTAEIVYKIFKILKINISSKTASALLSGIIGDTYSFTNPNVNNKSLEAASALLVAGASLPHVNESILKNKSVDSLKLWGKILSRLTYNKNHAIALTVVTEDDLKEFDGDMEVVAGVSNFLNNLSGVKASLVLIQQDDYVKGSLRTNDENVDVSELAKQLGGGGHKKAAGFKIKGKLKQDKNGSWKII